MSSCRGPCRLPGRVPGGHVVELGAARFPGCMQRGPLRPRSGDCFTTRLSRAGPPGSTCCAIG
eukprot:8508968-Lingulodinium_polyedra.AAC.1